MTSLYGRRRGRAASDGLWAIAAVGLAASVAAIDTTGSQFRSRLPTHGSGTGGVALPLRLCNAYPYKLGLDVFISSARTPGAVGNVAPIHEHEDFVLLTRSGPLGYKFCRDIEPSVALVPGSLLSFRFSGGIEAGAFQVSGIPAGGSLLQIAVHRHDAFTAAADFTSHVFSGGNDPEVAIVDAYRGEGNSYLELRLSSSSGHASVQERLRFGTAVTVPPGDYECALLEGSPMSVPEGQGEQRANLGLKLARGGKYTLMRIGVEALEGPSYPEGLVLWPEEGLLSGASGSFWHKFGFVAGSGAPRQGGVFFAIAGAIASVRLISID